MVKYWSGLNIKDFFAELLVRVEYCTLFCWIIDQRSILKTFFAEILVRVEYWTLFFAELLVRCQYWTLFLLKYLSEVYIKDFLMNYFSELNIEQFFAEILVRGQILKKFCWDIGGGPNIEDFYRQLQKSSSWTLTKSIITFPFL